MSACDPKSGRRLQQTTPRGHHGGSQAAANRDFGGPVEQLGRGSTPGAEHADGAFAGVGAKLEAEREAFDKHLQQLLQKNPELQQRLDEYLLARQRHEAVRKK